MPIFTMIISLISFLFACIFDKGIILGVGMLVGFISDVIFIIILEIKDKYKSEPNFIIDYRRTGYDIRRYKMAVSHNTRKSKPRRHTNRTTGSRMNGKKIDSKINSKNKLYF